MFVKPKPGNLYRHPKTHALVPADGFEADAHDLDIERGLQCGDLVPADPQAAARPKKSKARRSSPKETAAAAASADQAS